MSRWLALWKLRTISMPLWPRFAAPLNYLPRVPISMTTSATLLVRQDHLSRSQRRISEALELKSAIARSTFSSGCFAIRTKAFEPAEKYLARAVALDPQNYLAQDFLGRSLRETGKLPDAIFRFPSCTPASSAGSPGHFELARAVSAAGRKSRGRRRGFS